MTKLALETYGQNDIRSFGKNNTARNIRLRRIRSILSWSSFTALASSLTGALAAQSILVGIGVGNAHATILGASLSWMLKDGFGMVGKIAFAGWQGLIADIINDFALFLELASPLIPSMFTILVCTANGLKSIVSVAGGSTRAAITLHQALDNNVADVAAKDASQPQYWTMSNLLALIICFSMIFILTDRWILIWFAFSVLTVLHIYSNYRAVRCLQLSTFNRNRFHIAIQSWLRRLTCPKSESSHLDTPFPSIATVNRLEPIIISTNSARIHLGCSLQDLPKEGQDRLPELINVFSGERYLLYCPSWRSLLPGSSSRRPEIYIVLVNDCEPKDQLKAMLHAEYLTHLYQHGSKSETADLGPSLANCETVVQFSKVSLGVTHDLMRRLIDDVSKSPEPKWNLTALQFCADEWRVQWTA